jgi:hypothetical protein
LLFRGRAQIESGDDGAKPMRGRDRLKSGDARAEHEHASRPHHPCHGHKHREKLRQRVRRHDDRFISRNRGLRRERIHALRAADPRNRIHAERGHSLLRKCSSIRRIDERLQERDHRRTIAHRCRLGRVRALHLQDKISAAVERAGIWSDGCADATVGIVKEAGSIAGSRFNGHLESGLHKPARDFWGQRHATFTRRGFLRHGNVQ